MSDKKPYGVISILTYPDGGVLAVVTDFDLSAAGGRELLKGQTSRANRMLDLMVIEKCCAPCIAKAMTNYHCHEAVRHMINHQGFKRTVITIGHSAE